MTVGDDEFAAGMFQSGGEQNVPAHRLVGDGVSLPVFRAGSYIAYQQHRVDRTTRHPFDNEMPGAGAALPRDMTHWITRLVCAQPCEAESRPSAATSPGGSVAAGHGNRSGFRNHNQFGRVPGD